MILTNSNYSFAIFNYEQISWYASTSQGGNPETGTGGKAAKVGFNRGNGTLWYGHRPFSENAQLMQSIPKFSNVGIPGRFIFRIDEWIQPAGCLNLEFGEESKHSTIDPTYIWKMFNLFRLNGWSEILHIWPRNGNLLGGQEVNITGPCFNKFSIFHCKWGDWYDAPVTIGYYYYYYYMKTFIQLFKIWIFFLIRWSAYLWVRAECKRTQYTERQMHSADCVFQRQTQSFYFVWRRKYVRVAQWIQHL